MAEIIAFIIFLIGLIGMCAIILRKVSVLSGLAPEQIEKGIFSHIKSQIKEKTLKDFSVELYLHKILSKIRV